MARASAGEPAGCAQRPRLRTRQFSQAPSPEPRSRRPVFVCTLFPRLWGARRSHADSGENDVVSAEARAARSSRWRAGTDLAARGRLAPPRTAFASRSAAAHVSGGSKSVHTEANDAAAVALVANAKPCAPARRCVSETNNANNADHARGALKSSHANSTARAQRAPMISNFILASETQRRCDCNQALSISRIAAFVGAS
jgi:hypothetical protein